jgi:hypothetical protein
MAHWQASSGRPLYLRLSRADADSGHHQGPCDDDVAALARRPNVRRQLAAMDPATLAAELREYGAWDDDELSEHDANLERILWLACGDISEGNF